MSKSSVVVFDLRLFEKVWISSNKERQLQGDKHKYKNKRFQNVKLVFEVLTLERIDVIWAEIPQSLEYTELYNRLTFVNYIILY